MTCRDSGSTPRGDARMNGPVREARIAGKDLLFVDKTAENRELFASDEPSRGGSTLPN